MTATTAVDVDQVVEELTVLARQLHRHKVEAAETQRRRRRPNFACDTEGHDGLMWAGEVTGLCVAIAKLTGEHPDDVEKRIAEEASR